jgi:hypothetical protein
MTIDLGKLSDPFPAEDIEWRVSRAGRGQKGVYCMVLAYITARAIQKRLDDVCGPQSWRVEEPRMLDMNGKPAFAVGISIAVGRETVPAEWITKWDVCEPTNIEPAKGGFSGAMKRAGAQWGIGRYLYYLDENWAEVSETDPGARGWNYAKLPDKHGGGVYYWKPPSLPAWALPKEPEHEISQNDLNTLKRAWKDKFAPDSQNPAELREGFTRFVHSVVGEFPAADYTCWTKLALDNCLERITETTEPNGVSADVPFDSE